MIKKIIQLLLIPIGGAVGYWAWLGVKFILDKMSIGLWGWVLAVLELSAILIFAIIGFFVGRPFSEAFLKAITKVTRWLKAMPAQELLLAVVGLLVGLVTAFLVCQVFKNIQNDVLVTCINAVIYLFSGVIGVRGALMHRDEYVLPVKNKKNNKNEFSGTILDSSILVDGRITDIVKTGFVSKPIYIPKFVLAELTLLADSEDAKKRTRGRIGLDAVKKLQEEKQAKVIGKDYPESNNIDDKLIKLAKELEVNIMTNDYSLNMVASVQGVEILNINELVNALKPTVIAGDEIKIEITKAGKDPTQGVGYLDDGTMVVVEDGAKYIDKIVDTVVSSMLQTNAGKIIFCKIK